MKLILSSGDERKAFTLMELMVVLVLIGILTATVLPEMKGSYEDALLRSTSRELLDAFGIANSRAISFNQQHRVRIDTATGKYLIERAFRGGLPDTFIPVKEVPGSEGNLDPRISIRIRSPEEELLEVNTEAAYPSEENQPRNPEMLDAISFYPDGTADLVEVVLRDRHGFGLSLRINPITARAHLKELERE